MPTTQAVATMQDIANAIREKSTGAGATGPIPVLKFAERIKLIPRPATDETRKFVTFATEQTPAQMTSQRLIRCNGMPAYETPSTVIYDALKRDEWLPVDFPPAPIGPLALRQYHAFFVDGDNLYLCYNAGISGGTGTVLQVVNTKTGVITDITGLPNRTWQATGFFIVGNYIYIHRPDASHNQITRINRTDFSFINISLDTARQYNTCALLGRRLFFGWSATTNATVIPYIDTGVEPPTAGTITGLPNRPHSTLNVVGAKLYIGSSAAATEIAVITASGGTAPNYTTWTVSTIINLPSRAYGGFAAIWFLAGTFMYVGSSSNQTSIIRIQTATANNTTTQITLPERTYNRFTLANNKIYLTGGSASSTTTSIPVINNTTGALHTTITDLPARMYAPVQLVGNKLYLGSSSSFPTTLPIINTNNDTWSQITGLSGTGGGSIDSFHLVDTILYCVNSWPFSSPHIAINTVNDTVRVNISGFAGLGDTGHINPLRMTRVDRVDGHVVSDEFWYGRNDRNSNIAVLDLLAVNRAPSGATVNVSVIRGLPFRRPEHMVLLNDKVWMTGATTADSGSAHNTDGINMFTKALLPKHAQPVYIKY